MDMEYTQVRQTGRRGIQLMIETYCTSISNGERKIQNEQNWNDSLKLSVENKTKFLCFQCQLVIII